MPKIIVFNTSGLIGEDYTECSYLFIYIVSSYIFRTNIQKIFGKCHDCEYNNPLGFEAPKSQYSIFNPPGMPKMA